MYLTHAMNTNYFKFSTFLVENKNEFFRMFSKRYNKTKDWKSSNLRRKQRIIFLLLFYRDTEF